MSMQLGVTYQEEFQSKLGRGLVFNDRLSLYHTRTKEAYALYDNDPTVAYRNYKDFLNERMLEVAVEYVYSDEDMDAMFHGVKSERECIPVGEWNPVQMFLDDLEAFVNKYGVKNIKFFIV